MREIWRTETLPNTLDRLALGIGSTSLSLAAIDCTGRAGTTSLTGWVTFASGFTSVEEIGMLHHAFAAFLVLQLLPPYGEI